MLIEKLPNLGTRSAKLLGGIGVVTEADLREIGAVDAYCLLKAQGEAVSLNLLWALYGALNGLKWTEVSAETKADLLAQVDPFKFK